MRLLVTGTRKGRPDVAARLSAFLWARGYGVVRPLSDLVLVHGGARGVDSQAGAWARLWGLEADSYAAPWDDLPDAGSARNQVLVDVCQPGDVCLAFPDPTSVGTRDCVRRARRRGLEVIVFSKWGSMAALEMYVLYDKPRPTVRLWHASAGEVRDTGQQWQFASLDKAREWLDRTGLGHIAPDREDDPTIMGIWI